MGDPFGVLAVDIVHGIRFEVRHNLIVLRGEVQTGQILLLLVGTVVHADLDRHGNRVVVGAAAGDGGRTDKRHAARVLGADPLVVGDAFRLGNLRIGAVVVRNRRGAERPNHQVDGIILGIEVVHQTGADLRVFGLGGDHAEAVDDGGNGSRPGNSAVRTLEGQHDGPVFKARIAHIIELLHGPRVNDAERVALIRGDFRAETFKIEREGFGIDESFAVQLVEPLDAVFQVRIGCREGDNAVFKHEVASVVIRVKGSVIIREGARTSLQNEWVGVRMLFLEFHEYVVEFVCGEDVGDQVNILAFLIGHVDSGFGNPFFVDKGQVAAIAEVDVRESGIRPDMAFGVIHLGTVVGIFLQNGVEILAILRDQILQRDDKSLIRIICCAADG